MDIFIEVFRKLDNQFHYESVAVIDAWQSLRIVHNWYKPDTFVLVIDITPEGVRYFIPETCLMINDVCYCIDSARSEGDHLTVSGQSLSRLMNSRIVKTNYTKQAQPIMIAYDLARQHGITGLDFLTVNEPQGSQGTIRFQNSYGSVMDVISKLCETYDFGFTERSLNGLPGAQIDFSLGADCSAVVEFSADYENLFVEDYENSNADEKTTAYVLGEGEGDARILEIVNPDLTGQARKELYVDARDLRQEPEQGHRLTDAEYRELLHARGVQKLAELQPVLSLTGTINPNDLLFRLGTDYQLGDIVTIRSAKYHLMKKVRLTSIQQTWDTNGYHIDPVFGKESPTVLDRIERKM